VVSILGGFVGEFFLLLNGLSILSEKEDSDYVFLGKINDLNLAKLEELLGHLFSDLMKEATV